ncbi:hypothetical protein BVC80_1301g16 [Macleaya cordata]|uniref:DUF7903 domain-containing protein n=1 Tax=Macleaya cordata TaxID=56857 RepID=A0A200R387_MACCD|nr:hypothetical protein BVC80_1301g16 [Macleaya cordata]
MLVDPLTSQKKLLEPFLSCARSCRDEHVHWCSSTHQRARKYHARHYVKEHTLTVLGRTLRSTCIGARHYVKEHYTYVFLGGLASTSARAHLCNSEHNLKKGPWGGGGGCGKMVLKWWRWGDGGDGGGGGGGRRHSKDVEGPSPAPCSLIPQFQKNVNLRSSSSSSERRKDTHALQGGKIIYARHSTSRCYIAASTDDDQLPGSIRLEPISLESIERRSREKPLVLVCAHKEKEVNEITSSLAKGPWISIAEKIQPDLLASFQNVRKEMDLEEYEKVKPLFVARFGRILFQGSPSISLDTINNSSTAEAALDQVKKSFYTNVPSSYMDAILGGVVTKTGFDFDEEKENYQVKVFDKSRPNVTISCKCTATKVGGELELYKFELNQVRHLVVDIACLDKNLDLRLMLATKRILTALTDDEKLSLRNLIKSAVVDPDVKGGLRWPLGKESFGDRYCIVGVWHIKAKSFKNSVMRITLRHADRFDFRTSTGEVANEVILKMTRLVGHLKVSVNCLRSS